MVDGVIAKRGWVIYVFGSFQNGALVKTLSKRCERRAGRNECMGSWRMASKVRGAGSQGAGTRNPPTPPPGTYSTLVGLPVPGLGIRLPLGTQVNRPYFLSSRCHWTMGWTVVWHIAFFPDRGRYCCLIHVLVADMNLHQKKVSQHGIRVGAGVCQNDVPGLTTPQPRHGHTRTLWGDEVGLGHVRVLGLRLFSLLAGAGPLGIRGGGQSSDNPAETHPVRGGVGTQTGVPDGAPILSLL